MSNPRITIGELRDALAKVDRKHDGQTVAVWLPGSRIDIAGPIRLGPAVGHFPAEMLIEGNLREGSALES